MIGCSMCMLAGGGGWGSVSLEKLYQTVPALRPRDRMLTSSSFSEKIPLAKPYSESLALSMTCKV